MAFENAHNQPGHRFAMGSTKDDQILGAFGFVAHATLFMAVGSALSGRFGKFFWLNAAAATGLLVVRGKQVGTSTTKQAIQAIKDAWTERPVENKIDLGPMDQSRTPELMAEIGKGLDQEINRAQIPGSKGFLDA